MLVLCYPRCGTCKKALKWLDDNGFEYEYRHIVEDNPSREELEEWIPEHISMPDPDEFESYPIIVGNVETVSDVFYHSTDYNNPAAGSQIRRRLLSGQDS